MGEAAPFRRDDGGFTVDLDPSVRELLRDLAGQMREVLTGATALDDPAMARLFPPAYPDDPMRNLEFEHVAADDLQRDRVERFEVLARTAGDRWLTEEDLLTWMRAINDGRLVLGVRLDVTEDTRERDFRDDDAASHAFATYAFLSALLEAIVDALGDPTATG